MEEQKYYINNAHYCNQIMQNNVHERNNLAMGYTTLERLFEKKLEYLLDYIKRNPAKAIYIGEKVNATSHVIPKSFYDAISQAFPHTTVRWYNRPKVFRQCSCGRNI